MPAAMSMDLRLRTMRAVERGSSICGAARRFALSLSAASKLMQRVHRTGSAAPARSGGHRRPLLAPYEREPRGLIEATPDISLAELQAELRRRFGVVAGLTTLHSSLRRLGLGHEKALGSCPRYSLRTADSRRSGGRMVVENGLPVGSA